MRPVRKCRSKTEGLLYQKQVGADQLTGLSVSERGRILPAPKLEHDQPEEPLSIPAAFHFAVQQLFHVFLIENPVLRTQQNLREEFTPRGLPQPVAERDAKSLLSH